LVLEGKAVKEYSAPMTVEWDKESLQQNGKADVKFEFLPPPELITAKNEKSVALKICYQATSSSLYYRQQDIMIHIHYYPLLCLKDIKVTPHEEATKFCLRLIMLNCSPHTVSVMSNDTSFLMTSYSISRQLITCNRCSNFPETDDSKEWLQFMGRLLMLRWSHQQRSGDVRFDPEFVARSTWWKQVAHVLPMKFDLHHKNNNMYGCKVAKSPIKVKLASTLNFQLQIKQSSLELDNALLQCVIGDQCEQQPCNHVESDGTHFCIILGTENRIIQVRKSSHESNRDTDGWEFTLLATCCGDFSLYFILSAGKKCSQGEGNDIMDRSLSFVSQKWSIQVSDSSMQPGK